MTKRIRNGLLAFVAICPVISVSLGAGRTDQQPPPSNAPSGAEIRNRFLATAAAAGLSESETTKAIFEGRLAPDLSELKQVLESFGEATFDDVPESLVDSLIRAGELKPGERRIPAAHKVGLDTRARNRRWNARFGSIRDIGEVDTVVGRQQRRVTGNDILVRILLRERVPREASGQRPLGSIRFLPIARSASFVSYKALLSRLANAKARAELENDLAQMNAEHSVVSYFDDVDTYYSSGVTERSDYLAIRAARAANPLAFSLDPARWSYTHGSGFKISEGLRQREQQALKRLDSTDITRMLDTAALDLQREPRPGDPPNDALETLLVVVRAQRRQDAASVLATLTGWTPERAQRPFSFATYSHSALLQDIYDGRFAEWLGVPPAGPSGLSDRARGADLDATFLAYHQAYSTECRTDGTQPWRVFLYSVDVVTREGFDVERVPESSSRYLVRVPYSNALVARVTGRREGSGRQAARAGTPAIQHSPLGADFVRLLRSSGCLSDTTRIFEVNLLLIADGFPPLQDLLARQGTMR